MPINNSLNCQWIKCSNQKTYNGRLYNKTGAYNMLPIRDPLYCKGQHRLKVRGWEKSYFMKMEMTRKQG